METIDWRKHSANYAKGEKPPQTLETLQAAWQRDQELLLEQRAEISRLKRKLDQARQKLRKARRKAGNSQGSSAKPKNAQCSAEIITHSLVMKCDDCGNAMKHAGYVLTSFPPQHPYVCDCGATKTVREQTHEGLAEALSRLCIPPGLDAGTPGRE